MSLDNLEFFNKFYLDHSERLYRIARRLLNDPDLAHDVVNDTFLIVFLKIDIVRNHPNPVGWLLHTLKNRIGNELQLAYRAHDIPLIETIVADDKSVEEQVFTLADCLLEGLTDNEREILILFYEKQCSCEEISKIAGIDISACRTRLFRARQRFKQLTKENFESV